tara:strand:- start:26 stop:595 length:570 start_codon:yes stop_codon:yes gene_type:complete
MSKARELAELGDAVTVDAGNVGIGTAAPSHKAHISTTDSTPLNVEHSNGTDVYIKLTNTADGAGNFLGASSNNLTFFTENTERMRISSTGVISGDGSGLTGVGASTTFGAVGTYTWGRPANNTDYTEGDVATGLYTVGQVNNDKNPYYDAGGWGFEVVGTAMSGSWRAMARIGKDTSNQAWTGLWVRIS